MEIQKQIIEHKKRDEHKLWIEMHKENWVKCKAEKKIAETELGLEERYFKIFW